MSDNIIHVDFRDFDPGQREHFLERMRIELLPSLMLLARDAGGNDVPLPANVLMLLLMFLDCEVWGDETKGEFADRVFAQNPK